MLGIGIVTYERFGALAACLALVNEYTTQEFKLIVADDGSKDPSRNYCLKQGIDVVGEKNCGVAYNFNRALYNLRDCDPIIMLDSDVWPTEFGWQESWVEAANIWGHVNYGFKHIDPICGEGTPQDPFLCEHFGSGCVATSKSALDSVGYQDPRFYQFPFSIAHAEWTFRFERFYNWKKATENSTPPCLQKGVLHAGLQSFAQHHRENISISCQVMAGISKEEPVHRLPWRSLQEKNEFIESSTPIRRS